MAVREVCPLFAWIDANKEGYRVYKQLWQVITDDRDGPLTAWSATGLPQAGDGYTWKDESDPGSTCDPVPSVQLGTQDQGHRVKWHLTYTFTNEPRSNCSETSENPLDEPWSIEGDGDEWEDEVFVARDENGNGPYCMINSALEHTSHPAYKSRSKLILGKNYSTINQDYIELYRNSVNSLAITIFGKTYAPRTLFMRRIAFTRKAWGKCIFYYPTTFSIDIDPDTFDFRIANKGRRKRRANAPSPPTNVNHCQDITDKDLIRGRESVYLDANGNVLVAAAGQLITPTYKRWRFYRELDWSIFNIPAAG